MPEVLEMAAALATANVNVPTVSETAIVTSPFAKCSSPYLRAVVEAWAQLTLGTGTTAVTPRMHRGGDATGPVVGEVNAEQIKTAAGSTEPFYLMISEELANLDSVQYTFTLQQTAATGAGTALQAAIKVTLLSG
jgi:hypothetical protein